MIVDWNKPLTAYGAPARLLGTLAQGVYVVAVEEVRPFAKAVAERIIEVDADGQIGEEVAVVNVQKKRETRTAWINISEAAHGACYVGRGYHTEKEAATMRPTDFVDCIKIEWQQEEK